MTEALLREAFPCPESEEGMIIAFALSLLLDSVSMKIFLALLIVLAVWKAFEVLSGILLRNFGSLVIQICQ